MGDPWDGGDEGGWDHPTARDLQLPWDPQLPQDPPLFLQSWSPQEVCTPWNPQVPQDPTPTSGPLAILGPLNTPGPLYTRTLSHPRTLGQPGTFRYPETYSNPRTFTCLRDIPGPSIAPFHPSIISHLIPLPQTHFSLGTGDTRLFPPPSTSSTEA